MLGGKLAGAMDYSTILLWFSLVWACFHFLTCARFTSKLPPGPFPLPILGNLLALGKKPHHSLAELAKSYGPLMTIKLGSVTTIVVSSANMAREVLQKHDQAFSARTIPDAMRVFNHNEASVVWLSSTPQWRNLRKIFASQLVSTQRLDDSERIRLSKVKDLMDHIRDSSRSRRVLNIGQIVFSTTLNMISNTVFSMDLAHLDSDTAQEFKAVVWGVMEVIGRPNLANYFPLLRPLDPQGVRRRTSIYFGKLYKLFDTIIDERLQSKEEGGANDLLDTLLHQHTEENGFKLTRVEIKALLVDIFVAGTDTSAGTLEWAMTELLRSQHIMAKAKLELNENIDKDRAVEESDIARLPYLQAVVKETMRLHPPGPLLIPHRAETNVEICGFTVPKNAQVLINVWAINRDPAVWSRRICPGLPLAYRMLHLILASLLHSFHWELEDGMRPEDIDMEEKFAITLQKAKPLCAIPIEA